MTVACATSCLPFVAFFNPNEIIPRLAVYLGEYDRATDVIAELIYQGKRIPIQDHHLI